MIPYSIISLLQAELKEYLKLQKKEYIKAPFVEIFDELKEIVGEGKLFRGGLFLYIISLGNPRLNITKHSYLNVAMAIEIVHTAFLIHDDIMDKSQFRRGKPTQHIIWQNKAENLNISNHSKEHYGYAQAICMGDIALFLAQSLLGQSIIAHSPLLFHFVQKEWLQVCLGQMQDMALSIESFDMFYSIDDLLTIYQYKTAQYSFSVPLVLAMQQLDIEPHLVDTIYTIGKDLGILFQIQDDFLDIFGNTNHIKKDLGQDIREGKKTIYLYLLYKELSIDEKKYFLSLINKSILEKKDMEWLQVSIKDYGIITIINNICKEYKENILKNIELLDSYTFFKDTILDFLENSQIREF